MPVSTKSTKGCTRASSKVSNIGVKFSSMNDTVASKSSCNSFISSSSTSRSGTASSIISIKGPRTSSSNMLLVKVNADWKSSPISFKNSLVISLAPVISSSHSKPPRLRAVSKSSPATKLSVTFCISFIFSGDMFAIVTGSTPNLPKAVCTYPSP